MAMVDAMAAERARLGAQPLPRAVEEALRAVPREAFLPGLPLTEAYDPHQAVVTRRDEERGVALSSVSAPTIVAAMLERADLRPGHRVLEIGSGGYNAALIRRLVGADGQVVSIDIDPEVVTRAERCLKSIGVDDVHLAVGDGAHGFAARAPFDRIIVTAGAWDLPPAWEQQLAEDGVLVVPMRIRGLTRCLTLRRAPEEGCWEAVAVDMCGFVRMRGRDEHWEAMPCLHDEDGCQVALRLEDGPEVEEKALREALACEPVTVWSNVEVGAEEPTDSQDLYLASVADRWAQLTAERGAIKAGLVSPISRLGTPALISAEGTGFAYRTLRRCPGRADRWEFGAVGHGPHARATAEHLAHLIGEWDRDHRRGPGPRITLFPATTPDDRLPGGRVVDKRHTRTVLTWTITP